MFQLKARFQAQGVFETATNFFAQKIHIPSVWECGERRAVFPRRVMLYVYVRGMDAVG